MAKKKKSKGKVQLILWIILLAVFLLLRAKPEVPAEQEQGDAQPPQISDDSSFEVHYIDVGQADAALVLCDGEAMLIDGGNREDSSLIYSYLKQYEVDHLEYMVATHAHEDHAGGLLGALNYAQVDTAYCPVDSYESDTFENFTEYLAKQDKAITIPKVGDSFMLGSASVQIVGVDSAAEETNNTSIVLRVVYGDTSFLFTGDAEREAEELILSSGYEIESTVLKVGHHGSESSTSYPFLREVDPAYAVISVGEGNTYGHPTEEVLSRLRDADVELYRTDLQGTIVCSSDGETVTFKTQNVLEKPVGRDYVANQNPSSMKFHEPSCGSVESMKEEYKFYFTGTREELIAMGYSPCGSCKP